MSDFLNPISSLQGFGSNLLGSVKAALNPTSILKDALHQAIGLNPTKEPGTDFRNGDIRIESISLLSEDGQKVFDLMSQVVDINIYESILYPIIFATVTINDGISLRNTFPLVGHELIVFRIATPGGNIREYSFRTMESPGTVVQSTNRKLETYSINLCSIEAFSNMKNFIGALSYEDNINNVVQRILKDNLKTPKNIRIDKTKGIEKNTISLVHPFQAINHLKHIARSDKYGSHLWVFYESNRDGYVFTTMERLMENGAKLLKQDLSDKRFYFDTLRNDSYSQFKYRNILAYNKLTGKDPGATIVYGGLSGQVVGFDMRTGKRSVVTYNDSASDGKLVKSDIGGSGTNPSSFTSMYGSVSPDRKNMILSSAYSDQTDLLMRAVNSQAYVTKLTENITQIEIYGDFEVAIGDVIELNLPTAASSMDQEGKLHNYDSANYIVSAVRHIILNSDRPQHAMSLELLKVGYPGAK